MATIEEKRRFREAFLAALYDATDGDAELGMAEYSKVGEAASIPLEDVEPTISWLVSNFYVRWSTSHNVSITPEGVEAIEQLRSPTHVQPSPGPNVVQVFGDITGSMQVQQGSAGAQQVHGALDTPDSVRVIREIVSLYESGLEEADLGTEDRADAEEDLAILRDEIAKLAPKRSVLRRSLLALARMAEGLPANIAVALAAKYGILGL